MVVVCGDVFMIVGLFVIGVVVVGMKDFLGGIVFFVVVEFGFV